MFLGVFPFIENMKYVLKGRIHCTFRVFPGPFYCSHGSSLVELIGDDDSATSTIAVIRMSLKEHAWPSHILSIQQSMDQPRVRLPILLVVR